MPTKVKLQSSDGDAVDVDMDVIQCSHTIKTMLDHLGYEEGEEEVIPLTNVGSEILNKVITWATHHKV
jgi:S-phase kinase-associated protein 1